MEKCTRCNQEVEMMTGRNKHVNIDVSNSDKEDQVCIEVEAKVCPNCGKVEAEGSW